MPIVAADRLEFNRPDWLPFSNGKLHDLPEGGSLLALVSDAQEYFILLEGELLFHEGGEVKPMSAGQIAFVPPGTPFAVQKALRACRLIQLSGEPGAPFRPRAIPPGAVEPAPLRPLMAPVRHGFSVTIDPFQTFSPAFLGQGEGAGLILTADVANTPRNLLQEVRKHCFKEALMVAALILPLRDEKAVEEFVRLPDECSVALSLHPFLMGVEADLTTESGRSMAKALRRFWSMRLGLNGVRPCVRMPLGEWPEQVCVDLFKELQRLPPRRFGLVLTLESHAPVETARFRHMIRALDPWVAAIETVSTDQREAVSRVLDATGSQAWVLIRK